MPMVEAELTWGRKPKPVRLGLAFEELISCLFAQLLGVIDIFLFFHNKLPSYCRVCSTRSTRATVSQKSTLTKYVSLASLGWIA